MVGAGGVIVIRLILPLEVGGLIPYNSQAVLYMNDQPSMLQYLLVGWVNTCTTIKMGGNYCVQLLLSIGMCIKGKET